MKTEPSVYSIENFKKEKQTFWDGVRNYQARNFMMKEMQVGDQVLFYHSNASPSGIVGLAQVLLPAQADKSAWDKKSRYFDPQSTKENPRWFGVTIQFKKQFSRILPLQELKQEKKLKNMLLLKKGQRLSIQPVTDKEFEHIIQLTTRG